MKITDHDIYLFKEGSHYRLFDKLGSHTEKEGTSFAVWAPNAETVSLIGDFNGWNGDSHPLKPRWDSSGIWEGFVPGIGNGTLYKYQIITKNHQVLQKGDPFAYRWETPPKTASVVWDLQYQWKEKKPKERNRLDQPMSIYEMHFASWRRELNYKEMAKALPEYLHDMGYTHVEFLPLMEHPFFGSWGYQKVGYFAPSSRYGTPQDFMELIDALHAADIGVILDWVPSHFPSDAHGLAWFDGTHLYEHEDPKKGFHPDWKSYIFNYGRNEVRSFLISSAMFWCEKYHIDALRVDAVASMLYLDYSRKQGEWIPNVFGGNENLEAIDFIKTLNAVLYKEFPHIQTIAEESTAWPMVSRPLYLGGLGFGLKWNMGWMHDTLSYFNKDPVYRKFHHNDLLFSLIYAFNENFVLPLSHDEVVHGKGSLLTKMPGDDWQKFANLRLLLSYCYAHPGKKLLFMGHELGQWKEWDHESSLDWNLLDYPNHQGIQRMMKDLNHFYKNEPALYEKDFTPDGFQWVDLADSLQCVIAFLRKGVSRKVLILCNFTPVPRENYCIGVPNEGIWKEVFNTDSSYYGGSNMGNFGEVVAKKSASHGHEHSITLTLPPLSLVIFREAGSAS